MKAHEMMTKDVITVSPDATVRDIAALLVRHRISGLPVTTADRRVVGMVSQSDLLHKAEIGSEQKRKWWLATFGDPDGMAREYVKAHGQKAADIMSRFIVSVADNAEFADVANTLSTHRVKRVPVIHDGKLVGIITRTDVVRALAKLEAIGPSRPGDVALQKAVLDKMRAQTWLDTAYVNAEMTNGVVRLTGFIASDDQRRALRVLAEEVCGAGKVQDDMTVGTPDRERALN